MDLEELVKIEQQPPAEQTSNVMGFYMTHFYDQDSLDSRIPIKEEQGYIDQLLFSTSDILNTLETMTQMRTAPIQDIIAIAEREFPQLSVGELEKLRRQIIRRKNALKRRHAKMRDPQMSKNEYYVISDLGVENHVKEEQVELKKKRNRMSAQISRDRRKLKIKELQYNNAQLREQAQKVRQENQKLKRQLEEFNQYQKGTGELKLPKRNKFISLLVMLGIFFLVTALKDTFRINGSYRLATKMNKCQYQVFSSEDQDELINFGHRTFIELEELKSVQLLQSSKTLDLVTTKLKSLKSEVKDVFLPTTLKRQLEAARNQFL